VNEMLTERSTEENLSQIRYADASSPTKLVLSIRKHQMHGLGTDPTPYDTLWNWSYYDDWSYYDGIQGRNADYPVRDWKAREQAKVS